MSKRVDGRACARYSVGLIRDSCQMCMFWSFYSIFYRFHSFQFYYHSILRRKLLFMFKFLFSIQNWVCLLHSMCSYQLFHAGNIPAIEVLELYKVINNNRREEISYQKEVSGSCQREGSGLLML